MAADGPCGRGFRWPGENFLPADLWQIVLFIAAVIITGYLAELYNGGIQQRKSELFLRILAALGLAFIVLAGFYYFLPRLGPPRVAFALALIIFGVLQFIFHSGFHLLFKIPGMAEKILILGGGPVTDQIARLLAAGPHDYVLAGLIRPSNEADGEGGKFGDESLTKLAIREKVDKIVISLTERRGVLPVREILGCKLSGIEIVDAMSFYEQITGKLMVEKIHPSWFIFSGNARLTLFTRFCKRAIDLVFASIGILLGGLLLPLVSLLIKADSEGPVFFKQVRVGKGEQNFTLYKFRTMHRNAEKTTGAVWAVENDPRITRVGRWLRKTRLDEMPQLLNIIRGDMSLVGPRPERPEFVENLKKEIPYYSNRHSVKPGATGWAQIKYSYGASIEDAVEKLRYDLYYIKNYSLFLDLMIILETIKVVLFGRGAR